MFIKEDNTYQEIRERSVDQWLEEMNSHTDIAVRGGVKATTDHILDLKKQITRLEDKNALKDRYLKQMHRKVDNHTNKEKPVNIAKIMIPKVSLAVVHSKDTVRQGLEIMRFHGYTAIPVLDENEVYLGSITEGDFLRHILSTGTADVRDHEQFRIEEIFRPNFCEARHIFTPESELIEAALQQNFVPIVDDRNCLCGIVTRKALISFLAENNSTKTKTEQ